MRLIKRMFRLWFVFKNYQIKEFKKNLLNEYMIAIEGVIKLYHANNRIMAEKDKKIQDLESQLELIWNSLKQQKIHRDAILKGLVKLYTLENEFKHQVQIYDTTKRELSEIGRYVDGTEFILGKFCEATEI